MIHDGKQYVYCYDCGNIANGIVRWKRMSGRIFNIPICKAHIQKHFPAIESVPCIIDIDFREASKKLIASPETYKEDAEWD